MERIELLIEKIGGHNKYQIILSIILTISGMFNDFTVLFLTFMVSPPIVNYVNKENKEITEPINSIICKGKYEINEAKSNHNWSYAFKIYCESSYLTILQTSLLFGSLIGLICLRFFLSNKDKTILSKAANCLFTVTTCLVFFKDYWTTVVMTMLHGMCHITNFITRTTIIAEITDKNYRSYFISFQIFSGIVMGLSTPFLYNSNINWIYIYAAAIILNSVNTVLLFIFLKTTPTFKILNGDLKGTVETSLYIAKMNNKIEDSNYDYTSRELYNSLLDVNNFNNENNENTYHEKIKVRKDSDLKSDHQSLNNNNNNKDKDKDKENNDENNNTNTTTEGKSNIISNVNEFVKWIETTYFSQEARGKLKDQKNSKNSSFKKIEIVEEDIKTRKISDHTETSNKTKKSVLESNNNEELLDQSGVTEVFDLKYSKENNSFFTPTNYYDQSNFESVKENNTEIKSNKNRNNSSNKFVTMCGGQEIINIWILSVSAILFNTALYSVIFEVKNFSNDNSFNIMMTVSYIVGILLFPSLSWLSNRKKVGRKGTHLLVLILCLLLRASYFMIDGGFTIQVYMAIRALINANQIPVQALMSETFSNKKRVKLYSIIYILKSVTTLFVPLLLNYLNDTAFNIIVCTFLIASIVFGIFIEETNQKRLADT